MARAEAPMLRGLRVETSTTRRRSNSEGEVNGSYSTARGRLPMWRRVRFWAAHVLGAKFSPFGNVVDRELLPSGRGGKPAVNRRTPHGFGGSAPAECWPLAADGDHGAGGRYEIGF